MDHLGHFRNNNIEFSDEVESLLKSLETGQSCSFVTFNKSGAKSLLLKFGSCLIKEFSFSVLLDDNKELTIKEIEQFLTQASVNNKKIVILPFLGYADDSYFHEIQKLSLKFPEAIFISRIFVNNYERFAEISNISFKPFGNLIFVGARTKVQNNFELEKKELRFNYQLSSKEKNWLYNQSAGIVGLDKHLFNHLIFNKRTNSTVELLNDQKILSYLGKVYSSISNASSITLKNLNLIDSEGEFYSNLLSGYEKYYRSKDLSLTPSLEIIFQYLLRNEGRTVRLGEIDELVHKNGQYSQWATYRMISRLRSELRGRFRIRNVKGKGYILVKVKE